MVHFGITSANKQLKIITTSCFCCNLVCMHNMSLLFQRINTFPSEQSKIFFHHGCAVSGAHAYCICFGSQVYFDDVIILQNMVVCCRERNDRRMFIEYRSWVRTSQIKLLRKVFLQIFYLICSTFVSVLHLVDSVKIDMALIYLLSYLFTFFIWRHVVVYVRSTFLCVT